MKYLFLKEEDNHNKIIKEMHSREQEYHDYELNKLNYEHILNTLNHLPEEWPDDLIKFKGIFGEKLAEIAPTEKFELIVDLQFRDRVKCLLATTLSEQKKTEHVYNALLKRIPEDKMNILIQNYKEKN